MMDEPRRSRSTEAFFGRRRGKTLRPRLAAALETTLAGLLVDLDRPAPADPRQLFRAEVGPVRLEIGFGAGEHLLSRVKAEPEAGFIGVEPFVNGMARLLADIAQAPPRNLVLYDDDATRLLDWLPDASVASVDLLYPDPWPKKRHHKRRFVNGRNLDRLARVLAPGGRFRFASDIEDYVNWTLVLLDAHDAFDWKAAGPDDWRTPYPGWPGTRYEAKALREGRKPAYLKFIRRN